MAADPLQETAVRLLMRALAATGRAPEAMRIGREYRQRLADETGLDPSPALGELERRSPAEPPVRHTRSPRPRPTDEPADRPRGAGRGTAPAARGRTAGHARRVRRGRQDPGRHGGRATERPADTGGAGRRRRHRAPARRHALAIELAAGRLSTFSLADLRGRLDRSLDLLGGGLPSGDSRHRTLRATIEWSYELLTEDERRPFRHLSIFADGVDLDAAERVATDLDVQPDPGSVLARLVDASMIQPDFEGTTRYRVLGPLRAFGLDRLVAASEDQGAAARMHRWAVELTVWIETPLATEHEPEADAVLRRELPNLRGRLAAGPQPGVYRRGRRDGRRVVRGGRLPRPERDTGLGRGTG